MSALRASISQPETYGSQWNWETQKVKKKRSKKKRDLKKKKKSLVRIWRSQILGQHTHSSWTFQFTEPGGVQALLPSPRGTGDLASRVWEEPARLEARLRGYSWYPGRRAEDEDGQA